MSSKNALPSEWPPLARADTSCPLSPQAAQGGGHRTLLYGHAILLRHSFSGMVSSPGSLSPLRKEAEEEGKGGKSASVSIRLRSQQESLGMEITVHYCLSNLPHLYICVYLTSDHLPCHSIRKRIMSFKKNFCN